MGPAWRVRRRGAPRHARTSVRSSAALRALAIVTAMVNFCGADGVEQRLLTVLSPPPCTCTSIACRPPGCGWERPTRQHETLARDRLVGATRPARRRLRSLCAHVGGGPTRANPTAPRLPNRPHALCGAATASPVLSAAQHRQMAELGYLVVHEAVDPVDLAAVVDDIWAHTDGMERGKPASWYRKTGGALPDPSYGFQRLFHTPAMWRVRQAPRIHAAFAELCKTRIPPRPLAQGLLVELALGVVTRHSTGNVGPERSEPNSQRHPPAHSR